LFFGEEKILGTPAVQIARFLGADSRPALHRFGAPRELGRVSARGPERAAPGQALCEDVAERAGMSAADGARDIDAFGCATIIDAFGRATVRAVSLRGATIALTISYA
jgi:hypothetical protein